MTEIYKHGVNKPWVKAKDGDSGVCFTVSWDRFEEILKTGRLPQAFPHWRLKQGDSIQTLRVDERGITVFIESAH